jgi:hypothetical protein
MPLLKSLSHMSIDCPLVKRRIACLSCGYPFSEAMFDSVEDYQGIEAMAKSEFQVEFDPFDFYEEAKGG